MEEVMDLEGTGSSRSRWLLIGGSLACWMYLYLMFWLLLWVLVTRILFGWVPVVISTGSMSPTINPGDVVMLVDPPSEKLRPGAVITFEGPTENRSLVTHRVHGLEDDFYLTKGDANPLPDSTPVKPSDVQGVGRLLVPMVGLPRTWLQFGRIDLLVGWALLSALSVWLAVSSSRKMRAVEETT
jgi:signal peptidase I